MPPQPPVRKVGAVPRGSSLLLHEAFRAHRGCQDPSTSDTVVAWPPSELTATHPALVGRCHLLQVGANASASVHRAQLSAILSSENGDKDALLDTFTFRENEITSPANLCVCVAGGGGGMAITATPSASRYFPSA